MKYRLPLFALLAVLIAAAADKPNNQEWATPTKPVNKELPKWLRLGVEERARFESAWGIGFKDGATDSYVLNRLRLNLSVAPTTWMKFKFEGQDSRVWGYSRGTAPASMKNVMDLRQAYLDLGNTETGRFSLRGGRQSITLGEGRLMADPGWSNTGRTFDALRVTARHGRYKVDAFAASVVKGAALDFDRHTDADNFHGIYGAIKNPIPDSTLEPYAFWRLSRGLKSELGRTGPQDTKTVGIRWFGKAPGSVDFMAETARQMGSYSSDDVGAWAGHWVVGKTMAAAKRKPRIFGEYNFASGDSNPKDGRRGTFDQLYATGHDRYGLDDQFIWSNIHHARTGLEFNASKTVNVKASYHSFWLASARDGLYVGGKSIARVTDGSAGHHVGQEIDAQFFWNYTKSDQINVGYGRIFPGHFLKTAMTGAPFNLFFVNIARVF